MDKQPLIFLSLFLLVIFIFSGCEEKIEVHGETDIVEIIDYSVITLWHIPGYGAYQTYSQPGFYDDYPDNAYKPRYNISGTVKNIAGRSLKEIILTVVFCDSDMKEIDSENTTLIEFGYGQIKKFTVNHFSNNQQFKNIENVKFYVSSSN
jgi:hypothetical protein